MKNISRERLEAIVDMLVDLSLDTTGANKLLWHLESNGCTDDEITELGLEV